MVGSSYQYQYQYQYHHILGVFLQPKTGPTGVLALAQTMPSLAKLVEASSFYKSDSLLQPTAYSKSYGGGKWMMWGRQMLISACLCPGRSSWPWRPWRPWPSKVPIAERQPRHQRDRRGRCVSQGIISPRAEILLIRIADAKALTTRDAGRVRSIFYTCSIVHTLLDKWRRNTRTDQKRSDRRISERLPRNEPPSRVLRTPVKGSLQDPSNLDKVGIITDLNDKHQHQTEALKQSCDPVSYTNQNASDMQSLSIIALRNIAKHAAERFKKHLEAALCPVRHRRQGT